MSGDVARSNGEVGAAIAMNERRTVQCNYVSRRSIATRNIDLCWMSDRLCCFLSIIIRWCYHRIDLRLNRMSVLLLVSLPDIFPVKNLSDLFHQIRPFFFLSLSRCRLDHDDSSRRGHESRNRLKWLHRSLITIVHHADAHRLERLAILMRLLLTQTRAQASVLQLCSDTIWMSVIYRRAEKT